MSDEKKNKPFYRENRCPRCRALCSRENVILGDEEYKCPRCGEVYSIRFRAPRKIIERLLKKDKKAYIIDDIEQLQVIQNTMAKSKSEKRTKKELLTRIEELRAMEGKSEKEISELRELEGEYEEAGYNQK